MNFLLKPKNSSVSVMCVKLTVSNACEKSKLSNKASLLLVRRESNLALMFNGTSLMFFDGLKPFCDDPNILSVIFTILLYNILLNNLKTTLAIVIGRQPANVSKLSFFGISLI